MHVGVSPLQRLAGFGAADVGDGAAVDVRERLEVTFGVARRNTRRGGGLGTHVAKARAHDLPRLARGLEDQRVRLLLAPLEAALAAVNTDAEVVLLTAGDLRTDQRPLAAVLQAQQDVRVVLKLASRHEGREIGT